jgi:hypothetical protein
VVSHFLIKLSFRFSGEHFEDDRLRIIDDDLFVRAQVKKEGRTWFGPRGRVETSSG